MSTSSAGRSAQRTRSRRSATFTPPTSTKKMKKAIGVLIFRAMYDPRMIILPYGAATPIKNASAVPIMKARIVQPEEDLRGADLGAK